jgi:hypothetical protein
MAQTALSSLSYSDDLVKWEVDLAYCREAYKIKNATGAGTVALEDVIGMAVKVNGSPAYAELFLVANVANANGVVISGPPLEALASTAVSVGTYVVLVRGPAMVNKSKLKLTDLAASPGTMTLANLISALATNSRIQCFKEPPISAEQTT